MKLASGFIGALAVAAIAHGASAQPAFTIGQGLPNLSDAAKEIDSGGAKLTGAVSAQADKAAAAGDTAGASGLAAGDKVEAAAQGAVNNAEAAMASAAQRAGEAASNTAWPSTPSWSSDDWAKWSAFGANAAAQAPAAIGSVESAVVEIDKKGEAANVVTQAESQRIGATAEKTVATTTAAGDKAQEKTEAVSRKLGSFADRLFGK